MLLNYTHVESEIDYVISPTSGTFVTDDLVNLSPDAWNATLYYENDAFSARVSGAYRDDYLQRVPGQNNNDVEGKHATFNVDFALTWNINETLSLTLEGINLTDEFNDQFVDSVGDRPSVYHHTGRQFYTGSATSSRLLEMPASRVVPTPGPHRAPAFFLGLCRCARTSRAG